MEKASLVAHPMGVSKNAYSARRELNKEDLGFLYSISPLIVCKG